MSVSRDDADGQDTGRLDLLWRCFVHVIQFLGDMALPRIDQEGSRLRQTSAGFMIYDSPLELLPGKGNGTKILVPSTSKWSICR